MSEPIESSNSPTPSNEESLSEQFRQENRNRLILGILVLVLAAAVTVGFLFYFGSMSASPW